MNLEMNKYQTPITEELINSLPEDVYEKLLDIINNVKFVQHLISPNREYAKDRPRDSSGRIIIDVTNPHILEDMDYFRPTSIHYEKYGCFTFLKPNSNPNSEYGKWINQERDRCWNGYMRESDGEWVTGYMYFYMNYCPIMVVATEENSIVANRIEGFPETWEGVYLRFHYLEQARNGGLYNLFKGGNHAAELARRGCGKSFGLASIMSHNFILGENQKAKKRTMTVLTAYSKEYLAGKDGTISKFLPMIDFCATHTQFPRKRLKSSLQDMHWQMGYKDAETNIEKGSLNSVIAVSSKDDESKLRGKRGYILFEEFGTFPRLIDIYNIVRSSTEEGDYVYGLIYLVGTAGDSNSDFAGAQEIMYNPIGYNVYALPNVYDKVNQGKSHFVYFFPGYLNRKGCYNKDGVSDVIKALIQILINRRKVKNNSGDPNTILKTVAEIPITPAEAILKYGVNLFPVTYLTERLLQLDSNTLEYNDVYAGELVFNKTNEVEFKINGENPIRVFPHKDNKIEGCVEILKMPEKDKTGKVFKDRYILGADTYDDDTANTVSLGSIFVLDLWTDTIVAEYTGRPKFADTFYEICRRLCLFYDGRLNYENNKKGLFAYFSRMQSLYLLTDVLEFLKDKDLVKGYSFGNKSKGTIASAPINNYGRTLLKDWFLKPIDIEIESEDGTTQMVKIANLYRLRSRALMQEAIGFNTEGNFDRISAMIMLMLLREDKMILYQGDMSKSKNANDNTYLGNDPFFREYEKRMGITDINNLINS